jgi:hypothetical protein
MNEDLVAEKIIAMEKAALEKWSDGNPSGFIEICADYVVYFDPFNEKDWMDLTSLKDFMNVSEAVLKMIDGKCRTLKSRRAKT